MRVGSWQFVCCKRDEIGRGNRLAGGGTRLKRAVEQAVKHPSALSSII